MTVLALHRPIVPSPLNPDNKNAPVSYKGRRKIVTARRSAPLSPTQRLLRRKASEAFNAHMITTSLASAPLPPRSSAAQRKQYNQQQQKQFELAVMSEPLASFDDELSSVSGFQSPLALLRSPIAALLQILPLPLLSLFVLRFDANTTVAGSSEKEASEDDCFLQAAADLEECRSTDLVQSHHSLPIVLTMRRIMAALGFLCLYALMQFEPLFRRPARTYA